MSARGGAARANGGAARFDDAAVARRAAAERGGRHVAAAGRARRPRRHRSHPRGQRHPRRGQRRHPRSPRAGPGAAAAGAARPPLQLRAGAEGAAGLGARPRGGGRRRLRERGGSGAGRLGVVVVALGRGPRPPRAGRARPPDGRARRRRSLRVGRAAHRGGGAAAVGAGAAAAGEPRGVPGVGAALGADHGPEALPALAEAHPGISPLPVPRVRLLLGCDSAAILQRAAGHGVPQEVGLAGDQTGRDRPRPRVRIRGHPLGHAVPVPDVFPGLRLRSAFQRRPRPEPDGACVPGGGAPQRSRGPSARSGEELRISHGDPTPLQLRRERLRLPADLQRQPPDGVPAVLRQLDGVQRNAGVPGQAARGGAEGQEDGVGSSGLSLLLLLLLLLTPAPAPEGPRAPRGRAPRVRLSRGSCGNEPGKTRENGGKTAGINTGKHGKTVGMNPGKTWGKLWE